MYSFILKYSLDDEVRKMSSFTSILVRFGVNLNSVKVHYVKMSLFLNSLPHILHGHLYLHAKIVHQQY